MSKFKSDIFIKAITDDRTIKWNALYVYVYVYVSIYVYVMYMYIGSL